MVNEGFPTFDERYVVRKRLGRGGMAEVFQAIDTTLDRIVAIKTILPQLAGDSVSLRRFRIEAKAAARMSSPYVVNIHDWGENDGMYYIVMEYVRGVDLKEALVQLGTIHPLKVAEIAAQACFALQEAHRLNIVHRDIKPSNIMIQTNGDIKILDFGIAQAGGNTMSTHAPVGTFAYMSPEQRDGRAATPQSDIYSLGASMYELCTGVLPFSDVATLPMGQNSRELIEPNQLSSLVDDSLNRIILTAMASDPAYRYQSANDMLQALQNYLSSSSERASSVDYPNCWVIAFINAPEETEPSRGGASLGQSHGVLGLTGSFELAAASTDAVIAFNEPCVVGRGGDADIRVPNRSVSAQHALLTPRGAFLEVEDLASMNGTRVNGDLINRVTLCPAGTLLSFGDSIAIVGKRPAKKELHNR